MSTMKASLSPKAYAKILLHACRYPHKAINGVLIGEELKSGNDFLRIVDAIPLFHQCLGLAAMLEIALAQVSLLLVTLDKVSITEVFLQLFALIKEPKGKRTCKNPSGVDSVYIIFAYTV